MLLPPESAIAFKEWAAVCAALGAGRQSIILRKGGIDEGSEGFRVLHREFWLYPTNFHQQAENLAADAGEFVTIAQQSRLPAGQVPLRQLAVVYEVQNLETEAAALRLTGLHVWSQDIVRQRFHYRRPGLFLLVVCVFAQPDAVAVAESAEMAGCKSWVNLPRPIATGDLRPVLTDDQFAAGMSAVRAALAGG